MTIHFTSIGNNEIEKLPPLGDTIVCWVCGEEHKVESGKLAFFKCGDKSYLCGIDGKEWRPTAHHNYQKEQTKC